MRRALVAGPSPKWFVAASQPIFSMIGSSAPKLRRAVAALLEHKPGWQRKREVEPGDEVRVAELLADQMVDHLTA